MKYVRPDVEDYGDLVSLTADASGMAHLGFGTLAAVSSPITPTSGGAGDVAGTQSTGGDPSGTLAAGGSSGGDPGDVAGDSASGGGSGGGAGGGGGGGKLPFTGFAAAMVGAIGAGLTATGAAARRYLARR